MSGIERRTVYYEFDNRDGMGLYRFHDWNTVVTGIGHMMEPSQMVPRPAGGGQLNWEDTAIKVDIMQNMSFDKAHLLSGSEDHVIGNNLMPRTGR